MSTKITYIRYFYFSFLVKMKGDNTSKDNGVNEAKNNQEPKVSTDTNTMMNSDVDTVDQSQHHDDRVRNDDNIMENLEVANGDQSQVSEAPQDENLSHGPANVTETSVLQAQPTTCKPRRFGRKRQLSEADDELHMQADNASMIQSLESQPSQPAFSQLGTCYNCGRNKVELKRLQQTLIRVTKEGLEAKKRMDKNMATSLNAQTAMQRELTLLRSNNERIHIELTSVKEVLREIQNAIGRYKFK